MNAHTISAIAVPYGAPASRRRGIVAGIAVSLLLHLLLLYGYRAGRAPIQPSAFTPRETMLVWVRPSPALRQLPPPPAIALEEAPAPPEKAARKPRDRQAAARKPAPVQAQRAMTWRAPATPATPPPVAATTAPSSVAAPAGPALPDDPFAESKKPAFDMAAARRTARQVAHERDPAKAGTAVGQFPDKPLRSETQLARDIASAKRGDCKDGIPGGLLAPALLMLDKKDHGCKW
ncbi:MAG: hypothetical protein V4724_10685 [Pseudomonadota bacterium]